MTLVCQHCDSQAALPGGTLCMECLHAEIECRAAEIEAPGEIIVDGVEVTVS